MRISDWSSDVCSSDLTDADDAADTLVYTLVSGPEGATVSADGAFRWTAAGAVGSRDVTVRVTDPKGGFAERSFTIAVQAVPNAAPVLQPIEDRNAIEGEAVSIQLAATDADDAADAVAFTLVSGPAGAGGSDRRRPR